MSSISVNTAAGSPISITGLASGFNTASIISALVAAERVPITRLTTQQEKLQAQQGQLGSLQTDLQQLSFAAAEFTLPSLFEGRQSVASSEPQRVSASVSAGAAVGGYQVEVKQLANSGQRTFKFASPAAEDTVMIDGREYKLKAGASAKELASEINADGSGSVYAAVLNGETVVLSTRLTGATGAEFIKVSDPGGVLTEKEGTAREGKSAEYSVDGVEHVSASNTVTEAIPGVTLTLQGLTTKSGPVTIDVKPPALETSAVENQLQSFIKAYNATVEALQTQLNTKPLAGASNAKEYAVGTLFGDGEISNLLTSMRQMMYEPIAGLPAGMSSPFNIGVGAGTSGKVSQSATEGMLKLETSKLASALAENPTEVAKMMRAWSTKMQGLLNAASQPGGGLAARIEGDETQITNLKTRINTMNEALAERQKALVNTYAAMEAALARNNTQIGWLQQQTESLAKHS
jgi:flagellar hook-associated protein 2